MSFPSHAEERVPERLNVIALVSGGKDSFFSLLHCLANGHRVVALANLYPPTPPASTPAQAAPHGRCGGCTPGDAARGDTATVTTLLPGLLSRIPPEESPANGVAPRHSDQGKGPGEYDGNDGGDGEADLNSFMYQTVGHQVIPLYADATGIPLYRRPITGGPAQDAKEYSHVGEGEGRGEGESDETESMTSLLRSVVAAHPDANALCAGAILSTYQRTRVESVALRLGLTPLAYLWKYPVLPPVAAATTPGTVAATAAANDAQLLVDMAAAGLEARVVKVATGGLDESFLWENVASLAGSARIRRAMQRFGTATAAAAGGGGAVLGEGGEFETLVVDGPRLLFRKRIVVSETERRVVREGGGCAWLSFRGAHVEDKTLGSAGGDDGLDGGIRIPDQLDGTFVRLLEELIAEGARSDSPGEDGSRLPERSLGGRLPQLGAHRDEARPKHLHWCVAGHADSAVSIEAETVSLVGRIRARLAGDSLPPMSIVNTIILLRDMADFPTVNTIYGALFPDPNPPSRVTVSCGSSLPPGVNIAIYLSVRLDLASTERQGLHVQSRSYWAPANIGPYSQAVTTPLFKSSLSSSPSASRLVYVAGQIPLVPATMDLPAGSQDTFELQLVLSLQHLWRIGVEMGVQWWGSAVVYLTPRPRNDDKPVREKAILAARAWTAAHHYGRTDAAESSDTEPDDDGPDLWDRKFNSHFASFAGAEETGPPGLPDKTVLEPQTLGATQAGGGNRTPFVFAAEVHDLPRGARAEWHAHTGFARLGASSVRLVDAELSDSFARPCYVQHTVVEERTEGSSAIAVHSVLALGGHAPGPARGREGKTTTTQVLDELNVLLLQALSPSADVSIAQRPQLLYVDSNIVAIAAADLGDGESGVDGAVCPIVPCASLWDSQGRMLNAVAVYQSSFETTL